MGSAPAGHLHGWKLGKLWEKRKRKLHENRMVQRRWKVRIRFSWRFSGPIGSWSMLDHAPLPPGFLLTSGHEELRYCKSSAKKAVFSASIISTKLLLSNSRKPQYHCPDVVHIYCQNGRGCTLQRCGWFGINLKSSILRKKRLFLLAKEKYIKFARPSVGFD